MVPLKPMKRRHIREAPPSTFGQKTEGPDEGPDGFVFSPTSRRTLGPLQTADRAPRGPRGLVPEARGEPNVHRIGAIHHSNQIKRKPIPHFNRPTGTCDEMLTSCLRTTRQWPLSRQGQEPAKNTHGHHPAPRHRGEQPHAHGRSTHGARDVRDSVKVGKGQE